MALKLKKLTRNGRPLADFDYEIGMDRSGSMGSSDSSTGRKTRWQYGEKTIRVITEACAEIDDDGITLGFFDNELIVEENTTPDRLDDIYRQVSPGGTTDTAKYIQNRFDAYFLRRDGGEVEVEVGKGGLFGSRKKEKRYVEPVKHCKPVITLVFTDGRSNDDEQLKKTIAQNSKKLKSADEFNIVFIQIGDDRTAARSLKSLDDDLVSKYGAKFDIVSQINIDKAAGMDTEALLTAALTGNIPE